MSNLAQKLQDADRIIVDGEVYDVLTNDPENMEEGIEEACLTAEELTLYPEETYFTYDELKKADDLGVLEVLMLQNWDSFVPDKEDLERVCEENFPGTEVITFREAIERWSVLNKDDLKRMDDCRKLRVLGQTEDATDIITRATRAEYLNAKEANVSLQIMHAMQGGRNVVFYEWKDPWGDICKGGRYGLEPSEYVSFYL